GLRRRDYRVGKLCDELQPEMAHGRVILFSNPTAPAARIAQPLLPPAAAALDQLRFAFARRGETGAKGVAEVRQQERVRFSGEPNSDLYPCLILRLVVHIQKSVI